MDKEQEEEEKARVNDRRRFKSEEEETPKESQVKDESPSLVPSYVEILEKKVLIAEEKLQEHIARVNKESKEFRTRQEKDLERRIKILEKSDLYKHKKELKQLEQMHTLGKVNFDSVVIIDFGERLKSVLTSFMFADVTSCLLYTSDAADE